MGHPPTRLTHEILSWRNKGVYGEKMYPPMRSTLALVFCLSLSGCSSYQQAYLGPERQLNEVAVLVGGHQRSSGSLEPALNVDILAVYNSDAETHWEGGTNNILHLLPATYDVDVHLGKLSADSLLLTMLSIADRSRSDATSATLRIPMQAGRTYLIHFDRTTLSYYVSEIPTVKATVKEPGLIPYSAASECRPPSGSQESRCALIKTAPQAMKNEVIERRKHWPYAEW